MGWRKAPVLISLSAHRLISSGKDNGWEIDILTVQAERVAEKRAKFEIYLLTDKLGALNGVKDIDCCYAEATAVEEGVEVVV